MLARRVIALSPDRAIGKQIATALKAAGGAVEAHATLDVLAKGELQAALVVLHLDGALATAAAEVVPRLVGDARVIAILPSSNLAAFVDVMQSSERIAGMLVAEAFDPRDLTAMATRVLAGDIFGLEKMVPWGTLVHSQLVGDYQEKSACIAQVSEFADQMGVRRKYREAIEQCLDEMLMNALYDAPVDDEGKQIFSEIPLKTRVSLRVEQKAVVQYACDGKQFALSVRDVFGTLERETVLRYLHKCLHAEQQIDRKAGGAGLGLYMMVNSSTIVFFNVLPGVATEAVCVFDLDTPKLQLQRLGFFTEKIDAAGRLAAGPSRRLPAGASHPVERRAAPPPVAARMPRGIVPALLVAIGALFVLIAIAAWPRLFPAVAGKAHVAFALTPADSTVEIEGKKQNTAVDGKLDVELERGRAVQIVVRHEGYEPQQSIVEPRGEGQHVTFQLVPLAPRVTIDSQPPGATVDAAGKSLGTTPLTVTTFAPSTHVELHLVKPGYHDATLPLDTPGPGQALRVVQPLAVAEDLARVRLESDPPGAQVVQNGQLLAGVRTPAEVLVEAGKPQRFTLTMPHKVPVVLDPIIAARGADDLARTAKLVDGSEVRFEANVDGKLSVNSAPHCQALATPVSCVLAPGKYLADFVGPLGAHASHAVEVTAGADVQQRFEFGYVQAADGKKVLAGNGASVDKAAFEVGNRSITVSDEAGTHTKQVRVVVGTTVNVD